MVHWATPPLGFVQPCRSIGVIDGMKLRYTVMHDHDVGTEETAVRVCAFSDKEDRHGHKTMETPEAYIASSVMES
jgi:hypothetical protein